MLRTLVCGLALIGLGLIVASEPSLAQDKEKKQVKLEGKITCGKCDLGVDKACATVIVAKNKKGKEITYYFDAASHKKYHGDICEEGKPGTVTGTVAKDGKKMVVTVKELKYKE
jgi:hypothetical protein